MILFYPIINPIYGRDELKRHELVLTEKPVFNKRFGKHRRNWVDLHFAGQKETYKISSVDYECLDYKKFMDNIDQGDKVTVLTRDMEVLAFSKNGVEYMDFEKAQLLKQKRKKSAYIFFWIAFIGFIIPVFFKKQPVLKISGYTISVSFILITCLAWIITFLVFDR